MDFKVEIQMTQMTQKVSAKLSATGDCSLWISKGLLSGVLTPAFHIACRANQVFQLCFLEQSILGKHKIYTD